MLMMSPRSLAPCSLAHLRASLMAVSLASAPELEKKTRSAKECSHRSWARCACWGVWKMLDPLRRVAACSLRVPPTLGWLWPSAVTEMPPVKSRYSLPSESHTREPSPRTRATGCRFVNAIRCLSAMSIICFVSTAILPLENDLRADTFLGEHLEQDGVGHPPVDDMRLLRPARQGPDGRLDLGQHAAVDDIALDQTLRLALGQGGDVPAVLALDPVHVGEVNQLLGKERRRHVTRHEIGVDVVGLPFPPHADRSDDRDEASLLEDADRLRVDGLDLAHQADVGHGAVGLAVHALAGTEEAA